MTKELQNGEVLARQTSTPRGRLSVSSGRHVEAPPQARHQGAHAEGHATKSNRGEACTRRERRRRRARGGWGQDRRDGTARTERPEGRGGTESRRPPPPGPTWAVPAVHDINACICAFAQLKVHTTVHGRNETTTTNKHTEQKQNAPRTNDMQ